MSAGWYEVANVGDVPSPALLVYPQRIASNIERMIAIAGGKDRLRPHIKTHKMPEIMRMQLERGIRKFKAATMAECEMAAQAGAADVLLAYQPVGPNITRFVQLMKKYTSTRFSALVDDVSALRQMEAAAQNADMVLELLVDLDIGQHRSGIAPGRPAIDLYRKLAASSHIKPGGLHAYDGHIHDENVEQRTKACNAAFAPVAQMRNELEQSGVNVPRVVAGGTPTFAIHAARGDVECSPGTCVLSDHSYGTSHPDLQFNPAALVLTRVISKPGTNRVCLDLGHKAIASENPHPRVHLLDVPGARFVGHSEEHLVFETDRPQDFEIGDALYGVPWHVCPTVALHSEAVVVNDGRAGERWKVLARDRRITI